MTPETAPASRQAARVEFNDRLERSLLGSVLRNPTALDDVVPFVPVESFRHDTHRTIWKAIVSLWQDAIPVDLVSVGKKLQESRQVDSVGGYGILGELWDMPGVIGLSAVYCAEQVVEQALYRGLATAGHVIAQEAEDPVQPARNLLERAERRIFALAEHGVRGSAITLQDALDITLDDIDRRTREDSRSPGVLTGIESLDDFTAGFHPSEMVVIAARPSVGKTAFALATIRNIAQSGTGVFFSSLEQSRQELAVRLLCAESGVQMQSVRHGLLSRENYEALMNARNFLAGLPVTIDDSPQQTILTITANARRIRRRQGLGLVVIDYLGLIEPEDRKIPRHEQVGNISRRIKQLARDLEVPVVILCQLNRNSESRSDQTPRLSDLRESGNIEQDADTVLLLNKNPDNAELLDVIIAKQRNGPTGEVSLRFDRPRMRIDSPDNSPF